MTSIFDPQQLNRPESLNAWNETLLMDMVAAFRDLDEHPDTVFTVLTGEGRFFSAGADIKGTSPTDIHST
jgi:peroxisomal 3,2-trans-enoyl-CoA isomerase